MDPGRSAGFNARLDFGELALRGRLKAGKPTWLMNLALTLLVLGVLADDANDAAAVDYLALVTDLLD
jgi:hypothetical protein